MKSKNYYIIKFFYRYIFEDFSKLTLEKNINEIALDFQKFIRFITNEFCKLNKIQLDSTTEDIYNNIIDNFESIISKKLYNKIFCSTRKEKEEDFIFDNLLSKYSFITPDHLEIKNKILNDVYLNTAINKLSTINLNKTPKEKILTFINTIKIIATMVEKYSDKKDTSCGADEVFPILVYICIKGKIQKLKSNINYIILFRNEVRLQGMEDYYKENFNGVIKFIENLKFTDLKIDEDEFNKNIKLYENNFNNDLEKNKNSLEEIYNENTIIEFLKDKNIDKNLEEYRIYKNNYKNRFGFNTNKFYYDYLNDSITQFNINELIDMKESYKNILNLIDDYKNENGCVKEENKNNQNNQNQNIFDFFSNQNSYNNIKLNTKLIDI